MDHYHPSGEIILWRAIGERFDLYNEILQGEPLLVPIQPQVSIPISLWRRKAGDEGIYAQSD